MRLELSHAALEDLRSIRAYTLETWGAAQEQSYLDAMWRRFEQIGEDPGIHRFRNNLFPACQIAAEGKHVILFRVSGEAIQIVRVLHSAMDFRRQLDS